MSLSREHCPKNPCAITNSTCLHLQRTSFTGFTVLCVQFTLCNLYISRISYLLIKFRKNEVFVLLKHDFLDFDFKMTPTIHKYGMEPTWVIEYAESKFTCVHLQLPAPKTSNGL